MTGTNAKVFRRLFVIVALLPCVLWAVVSRFWTEMKSAASLAKNDVGMEVDSFRRIWRGGQE